MARVLECRLLISVMMAGVASAAAGCGGEEEVHIPIDRFVVAPPGLFSYPPTEFSESEGSTLMPGDTAELIVAYGGRCLPACGQPVTTRCELEWQQDGVLRVEASIVYSVPTDRGRLFPVLCPMDCQKGSLTCGEFVVPDEATLRFMYRETRFEREIPLRVDRLW
jgi:hypothetical protein